MKLFTRCLHVCMLIIGDIDASASNTTLDSSIATNASSNQWNESTYMLEDVFANETDTDVLIKHFVQLYPIEEWMTSGYFTADYLRDINPHWLRFPPRRPQLHYALAIIYSIIMCCGVSGNFLVIFLFLRRKALRTPANILVFNLACSDLLMMLKMPIFIYNSLHLGPALGANVCRAYGFIGGLSGTCSICTITAISLDRYYVIKYPLKNRFSSVRAKLCVLFAWLYSICFAAIPLIDFGYGKYTPEGFLTACSFDYLTDDIKPKLFIWTFGVAAYAMPICLITYFYWSILSVVLHSRQAASNHRLTGRESQRHMRVEDKKKQELHVTMVVLGVVVLWFLAWTPYAVVALLGVSGHHDMITPLGSMVPALFCKTAAVCDPFIYALTHPKFKAELLRLCGARQRSLTARSTFTKSSRNEATVDRSADINAIETSSSQNGAREPAADKVDKQRQFSDVGRQRKYWWHTPTFHNRSSSWTKLSRTFSNRRKSSKQHTYEDDFKEPRAYQDEEGVEVFVLQSLRLDDDYL